MCFWWRLWKWWHWTPPRTLLDLGTVCCRISGLGALLHGATFTGNLEATNCSACYRNTLVAHESFFKQCLMICKNNMWTFKRECILFSEIAWNRLPVNCLVWHDPYRTAEVTSHWSIWIWERLQAATWSWSLSKASESTQFYTTMVFFLSLSSCNFDDQLSQNCHRFVIF